MLSIEDEDIKPEIDPVTRQLRTVHSEDEDIKPFEIILQLEDFKGDNTSRRHFEWDCYREIQLFLLFSKHKVVGVNKHFQMACIIEKLSANPLFQDITSNQIWDHLKNFYDLTLLETARAERIPFPNHETAFTLPENEFGDSMKQRNQESLPSDDNQGHRSPSPKLSTSRSNSRSTSLKETTPKALRKDSMSPAIKTRKESGSSHASTDTPSIKSEKDYEKRRDSRDSNASGPRDNATTSKSVLRSQTPKSRVSSVTEEDISSRRGRRRANTSTPPAVVPAKRRRI